jgi:RNA polymerase sigma-B factor
MAAVTNESNIELVDQYRREKASGDASAARRTAEKILLANEGLVKKFGLKFGRPQTVDAKEDIFQAARMGILRAIEDFDPAKGSFSTHAQWHIRDYVQRWSGKTSAVTRPRSASMPGYVAKALRDYRQKYGREPEASDLGVTEEQLSEWTSTTLFVEIDDGADVERPRHELAYDEDEAENATRYLQLEACWKEALEKLSPRNRVICERVIMQGEEARSVGRLYGLTHGRVLQICKRVEVTLRRALNQEAYDEAQDWALKARIRARATYAGHRTS